ncbi:hypothetical protein FKM82_004649 [Ascaphus truei]
MLYSGSPISCAIPPSTVIHCKSGTLPLKQGWGTFFLPRAIWIFITSFAGHTDTDRQAHGRHAGTQNPAPLPLVVAGGIV